MRDPDGTLTLHSSKVIRNLTAALDEGHFLHSELARRWVDRGDLVPFSIESPVQVSSPRLPLITQPTEWCDLQFYLAAELTLRLQREAVEAGFDLKDASAWNIIFDGTRPLFCDLLSLQPLRSRRWLAAGQFARHFVLPLLLSKHRGQRAHEFFKIWRDGVPHDVAAQMFGARRYLTRYWPLMKTGIVATDKLSQTETADRPAIANFRRGLQGAMEWMLTGVSPTVPRTTRSVWSHYTEERGHYNTEALALKRQTVSAWLSKLDGACVLDIGSNSGEFSRLALDAGGRVVALDADHEAVTQAAAGGSERLTPVVARIDDLVDGRGWLGQEHPGLLARLTGQVECVMMLAVVHHLAVAASVPLDRIPGLVMAVGARHLVLELIGEDDPQMQLLCTQFDRSPKEFSIERQLMAFTEAGFKVAEACELPGTQRRMVLMVRA